MKHTKKILKFKKIKIANMNFIKGGDETTDESVIVACQSGANCPDTRFEATNIDNPCSDVCTTGVGFGDRTEQYSYRVEKCYNIFNCGGAQ